VVFFLLQGIVEFQDSGLNALVGRDKETKISRVHVILARALLPPQLLSFQSHRQCAVSTKLIQPLALFDFTRVRYEVRLLIHLNQDG